MFATYRLSLAAVHRSPAACHVLAHMLLSHTLASASAGVEPQATHCSCISLDCSRRRLSICGSSAPILHAPRAPGLTTHHLSPGLSGVAYSFRQAAPFMRFSLRFMQRIMALDDARIDVQVFAQSIDAQSIAG